MSKPSPPDSPTPAPPARPRLSPVQEDPQTHTPDLGSLTPHQRALRSTVIDAFNAKKARRLLERQVQHINANRSLADGIKFLFDEHGKPPPNAPLEDIVAERKHIEYQIQWFEGMLLELRNRLIRVREVEDYALEMLSRSAGVE